MPSLILGSRSLAAWSGRTVVVGVTGAEPALAAGVDLPKSTVTHLDAALPVLEVGTKVGATTTLPAVPGLKADKVVLVGLGEEGEGGTDALRRAAGAAVRAAGKGSVALALPHEDDADLAAIAEGALSGDYRFTAHKSAPGEGEDREITVFSTLDRKEDPASVLETAATISRNVAWARDLVNTAPNLLFPQSFAEQVQQTAKASSGKLKVEVLDDTALLEGGFGGIVGVGQGSSRPPRIVVLSYAPRSKKVPHVALVGKGITFDSGGLCIKPGASMVTMKCDMAGAAAVAAATAAIAALGLPIAVTTYLCLAENLTGADAQRPGDVVTMPNGKSVEIINTDAEGRLVMADGLCFASTVDPDLVIDVATLTGAAVLSLGPRTTAVLSNQDALRDEVLAAAGTAGEAMWPIPLLDELRPSMKSNVADVKHTGERMGGMITAALFLREFVGDDNSGAQLPWAHLDIAGPAFNEAGAYGYTPAGATGHSVRTLVALAEARA